jgi:hypothetical protein
MAFLMAMATASTREIFGILAVDPNVAEPLAVVTLCENSLGFV